MHTMNSLKIYFHIANTVLTENFQLEAIRIALNIVRRYISSLKFCLQNKPSGRRGNQSRKFC